MSNRKIKLKLVLIALALPLFTVAQQNPVYMDTTYRVKLIDGTRLNGKVVRRDSDKLVLQSPSYGDVTIVRDSIRRMKAIWGYSKKRYIKKDNIKKSTGYLKPGRVWGDSLMLPHYFISSSAIPMQKEELDLQDAELFYVKVNYAFTNFISGGCGVDLLTPSLSSYSGEGEGPLYMANFKVGHKMTNWLFLGANAFAGSAPADIVNTSNSFYYFQTSYQLVTMAFAVATVGNINNNLSAAVGYDYVGNMPACGPTYTLSGMVRINKHLSLITENWLLPLRTVGYQDYYFEGNNAESYYLLYDTQYGAYFEGFISAKEYFLVASAGIRISGKRIAFDLGIATNQNMIKNIFPGYPFASCTFRIL